MKSDPIYKHAYRHPNLQSSVWPPRIHTDKSCKAQHQDVPSTASLGRGHFSLARCVGGRVGRGVQTVPGLYGLAQSVLVWFSPEDTQNYRSLTCEAFKPLNLKDILGNNWEKQCWIQLLTVGPEEYKR